MCSMNKVQLNGQTDRQIKISPIQTITKVF